MILRPFCWTAICFMLGNTSAQNSCRYLTASQQEQESQEHQAFLLPGSSVITLNAKWGPPEETIGNILVYRKQGSLMYLNADHSQIMAFVGSWFPGHGGFSQRILGIGLGTTYPKCLSLLGTPLWRKPMVENIEEVLWHCGELEIRCEIWTQNDYDPDIGGNIYAETVKRIQVQKPWKP